MLTEISDLFKGLDHDPQTNFTDFPLCLLFHLCKARADVHLPRVSSHRLLPEGASFDVCQCQYSQGQQRDVVSVRAGSLECPSVNGTLPVSVRVMHGEVDAPRVQRAEFEKKVAVPSHILDKASVDSAMDSIWSFRFARFLCSSCAAEQGMTELFAKLDIDHSGILTRDLN